MLLSALCIAAVSCKKEEILEFGGQMDKFSATDPDGQKTYLGHAEEWIYWETGDQIKINTGGSNTAICELINGAGTLDAFFKSTAPVNTEGTIHAIYPPESYGSTYTDLIFPTTQKYRESGTGTHPDSSFGRGALPMVAYSAPGMANHDKIYFHVVAGILRVQIFSNTTKTVDWIRFKEVTGPNRDGSQAKQISGHFNVVDINQNMPYLTGTSVTDDSRTITITNINKEVGPSGTQLLTFYLPLPAVDGPNTYTHYILRMTIKTTDGYYFTRDLGADIHRRNITMMRALEVTDWAPSEGGETTHNIQLVGNGTKDRPFQIYTGQELGILRNIYNTPGGTINGQTIKGYNPSAKDEATYIKIVRSDIELLNSTDYAALPEAEKLNPSSRFVEWTEGIQNFKGYMYFASSTATNGGITNRSNAPLFESILSDGYVNRVYVKSKQRDVATDEPTTPTVIAGGTFSPMCNVNNGTMKECHNKCKVTVTGNVNLAGLCVTNEGQIIGGANEAQLVTDGNVAGICYNNNGQIQGNFALSVAVPQGQNIAGIAYNNNSGATVKDCQVSSNIPVNSTGNWGVIVFNNNAGATIDNCTSTGAIVYTINGSVGGICNENSGTVKNCTNNVEIRGAQGNVGGIVATMDNAAAEVYNCCTKTAALYGAIDAVGVANNCGGIVGELLKGKVYNCYNASIVSGATNSGGMIGRLAEDEDNDVQNCWSAQGKGFVGLYDGTASVGDFCFSATIAAATNCNRIYNATSAPTPNQRYTIVSMHNDQTLGGTVTPSSFVDQHCGVALNAWVSWRKSSQGDSRDYYNWTTDLGLRPSFQTGMPGTGKGRRK